MSQKEKVKGVADIVFLIDVTGSMAPCINALKENINTFITTLTTKGENNENPVKDWRARVVGYRDFTCDPEPFVDASFVRDVDELRAQLERLEATGGGDEPESLLDALYKVTMVGQTEKGGAESPSQWRYRSAAARVVIVFTDASFHKNMSIPEAKGGTIDDLINLFQDHRIILSIFAPDLPNYHTLGETDKSEYSPLPPHHDGPQEAMREFTSHKENFSETMKMLAKSVSQSADVVEA